MAEKEGRKPGSAFETAVKYLAVSPRSEKEVREKLYSKGFRKAEVEEAIAKAKGYRYIDDESYVRQFAEYYGSRYGKKKLIYKLTLEKGISRELAESTVEGAVSDEAELEKARRLAASYMKKRTFDKGTRAKLGAHLYSKGFDWAVIGRAVDELATQTEAGSDENERNE